MKEADKAKRSMALLKLAQETRRKQWGAENRTPIGTFRRLALTFAIEYPNVLQFECVLRTRRRTIIQHLLI